jgi:hypothetical protein
MTMAGLDLGRGVACFGNHFEKKLAGTTLDMRFIGYLLLILHIWILVAIPGRSSCAPRDL